MHYSSSKALLIKAAGLSVFALAVYAGSASTANALLKEKRGQVHLSKTGVRAHFPWRSCDGHPL
jgi:hypothetical protein